MRNKLLSVGGVVRIHAFWLFKCCVIQHWIEECKRALRSRSRKDYPLGLVSSCARGECYAHRALASCFRFAYPPFKTF